MLLKLLTLVYCLQGVAIVHRFERLFRSSIALETKQIIHTEWCNLKKLLKDPLLQSQWTSIQLPHGNTSFLLHEAIREGETDVVDALLKNSAIDPSTDKNSAIIFAAIQHKSDIIKILLKDPRVDPSAQNNRALNEAKSHGFSDIMFILLEDERVRKKIDS